MGNRYTPVRSLFRCNDCTTMHISQAAPSTVIDGGDGMLILDPDAHDRWHNELTAAADPGQGSLLGDEVGY